MASLTGRSTQGTESFGGEQVNLGDRVNSIYRNVLGRDASQAEINSAWNYANSRRNETLDVSLGGLADQLSIQNRPYQQAKQDTADIQSALDVSNKYLAAFQPTKSQELGQAWDINQGIIGQGKSALAEELNRRGVYNSGLLDYGTGQIYSNAAKDLTQSATNIDIDAYNKAFGYGQNYLRNLWGRERLSQEQDFKQQLQNQRIKFAEANKSHGDWWDNLLPSLGTAAGYMLGGPVGGFLGNWVSSLFSGKGQNTIAQSDNNNPYGLSLGTDYSGLDME